MMSRPHAVQFVIVGGAIAAALGVVLALHSYAAAGVGSPLVVVAMGVAIYVGWRWPVLVFRAGESEGYQLDEGYFVVLGLLAKPLGVLLAFGAATIASQLTMRRPFPKAVFNVAVVMVSTLFGLEVMRAIAVPGRDITPLSLVAAALGSVVYSATNTAGIGLVLTTLGVIRFRSVLDTMRVQALLVATAIFLGSIGAVAGSRHSWSALLLLLPFWAFRQTLAGSFQARHDHARLHGLLAATLEVQRSMGGAAVAEALCREARRLLRCSYAAVVDTLPASVGMHAPLTVRGERRWLVVSGRSRTEPFDDADHGVLDALAAAGAAELENASLYEERRLQEEEVATITANLGEGVCAFDAQGRVNFVNRAGRDLLSLRGEDPADPLHAPGLTVLVEPALRVISSSNAIHSERGSLPREDGTNLPVEYTATPIRSGESIEGAVVTFRDISERLAFEEQLEFHAFRDALTGLPNRRVFLDRLEHALARAARNGELIAVFFGDVDRFKVVNDSLGHHAGDQLLVAIAQRLSSLTRTGDTLARFGGDEFTLLIEGIADAQTVEAMAERMTDVVHQPVELEGGRSVVSTISVGVALAYGDSSADDVLHNADVAMYQAKRRRAGQFALFDADAMATRSAERVDLESALREALRERALSVYYQPLFSAESGAVVGAEALVRWQHPQRGLLQPGSFIGLAEETGLVLELGEFVLEGSCRLARYWQDRTASDFTVSVNLSAQQFQDAGVVAKVGRALAESGTHAGHLCLEITESLALQDIDRSIATLGELKALGVRLAIDDFGTGYSSLTYLKRFPVDVVKLDRTFVQDLAISSVDAAIVVAVVDLARNLGLTAVAEGVETEDQLVRLQAMGCPVLQGYLLARPMPEKDFRELVFEGNAVAAVADPA